MARVGDHVFGVGQESSWTTTATAVSPTTRYEVLNESLKLTIDRIESKSLKASRRFLSSNGWIAGNQKVEGDVEIEIPNKGLGIMLKNLLGSVSTGSVSNGLYTHTITSGSIDSLSLTTEIQRTDVAGTAHRFTYAGCAITDAEFSCKAGEIATVKFGITGQSETVTAASATAASYPSSTPLVFSGAAITIGGGDPVRVKDFSCKIANGRKTDRYSLGSDKIKAPVEADMRSVEGKIAVEWESLTQYNRYINSTTSAALVAKFESQSAMGSGSDKGYLQITIPAVGFNVETPVGGGDIIEHSLDFVGLDNGTDEPVTIAYKTTDSSI